MGVRVLRRSAIARMLRCRAARPVLGPPRQAPRTGQASTSPSRHGVETYFAAATCTMCGGDGAGGHLATYIFKIVDSAGLGREPNITRRRRVTGGKGCHRRALTFLKLSFWSVREAVAFARTRARERVQTLRVSCVSKLSGRCTGRVSDEYRTIPSG